MKRILKRAISLLLGLLMCIGAFATAAVTAFAEEDDLQKGEFTYAPHTYPDGDLTDIYYYTDSLFTGSALEYNAHLATMSMILAAASISSQEPEVDYSVKNQNLLNLLRDIGFRSFDANDDYEKKPGEQTMGVAAAYKVIGEGEDAYTVLAIIPRSAGYEKEWAGNFTVGKDGLHQGFATGRDILLEFAKSYVEENKRSFKGTVKIWTVGYSRGAGVANLFAAYLDDNREALGIEVAKENIFAYNFGTPATVQYANEDERLSLETDYANIHNRYSEYDIVTYAPFKNWGFAHYGTTKLFDVHHAEAKAEMLNFLAHTNKQIYDLYTAENSAADPDNFMAVMLEVGEGMSLELVPADPAYGIPQSQKDFLESRIAFLVEKLIPDRTTYVDGGYEYALQRLTSLYFGLDAEQSALLFEGMSHDLPTLAASYYCYFLSDLYLDTEKGMNAVSSLLSSLESIKSYVEALAEDEAVKNEEWFLWVRDFIEDPEKYAHLEALLRSIQSGAEDLAGKIEEIRGEIKSFAVGMTATVLGSGVSSLTVAEEEKAALLEEMTSDEVASPLTELFVYLLLGCEESELSAFDPSNKSVALAVTFLSNAGRYMRVHNNEIILSWLRTEDSYYANEDWHIHDTVIKYDVNGHWHECSCGYKEDVCMHFLSDWSKIPITENGREVLFRTCPCGYRETQDVSSMNDGWKTVTAVAIGIGAVALVAGTIITVRVTKKRKERV